MNEPQTLWCKQLLQERLPPAALLSVCDVDVIVSRRQRVDSDGSVVGGSETRRRQDVRWRAIGEQMPAAEEQQPRAEARGEATTLSTVRPAAQMSWQKWNSSS